MGYKHKPVLVDEVLSFIPENATSIWDCTVGAGGHLEAIFNGGYAGRALATDADEAMLQIASERLGSSKADISFEHGFFDEVAEAKSGPFDFILIDLGISSYHLDEFERGFTYRFDQPLDMRLNTAEGKPVSFWLEKASEREISQVLFDYGEERKARKIARMIVERQGEQELTTEVIKDICKTAYRKEMNNMRHTARHPYVKTMQALRIFVNDELGRLERALKLLPELLSLHGRLAIISFHSLEDRRVKQTYRALSQIEDHSPTARSNYRPGDYRILTRKPLKASDKEIAENQRARSACLRVLERVNVQ